MTHHFTNMSETKLKFQQPTLLELPKFKTALEYRDRFTFGIDKLDSILELHLDDMIGIFGETRYTNALATRLVVRSLLPRNHGGVDAGNVIVIDADNSSSPYLYVDIGRQYGMHHRNVLHKVLVSRQFTIYQLTNTITLRLAKANTTTQTKSNSHFRIVRSILSRSLHSILQKQKV